MTNFKKIITLLSFLLALNLNSARAEITDSFMLKSALTVEYQGTDLNSNGQNDEFKRNSVSNQLKNFENIVLGLNLRVHKYLGFNLNWMRTGFENKALNGFGVGEASLKLQNFNATSLLYFPIIGDHWLEGFAELGIADINSRTRFTQIGSRFEQKSHETALLYGAGIQFMPYDSDIAFRFGFQKYQTDLGIVKAKMAAFRGGVVIPF
ncbi:MAG: hypothetical protein K0R25_1329 [Rickettsiaceae bacterium]|jgi:hypothetical protein|nr:hypothetical protein [Rickettsiaceae bacterium]